MRASVTLVHRERLVESRDPVAAPVPSEIQLGKPDRRSRVAPTGDVFFETKDIRSTQRSCRERKSQEDWAPFCRARTESRRVSIETCDASKACLVLGGRLSTAAPFASFQVEAIFCVTCGMVKAHRSARTYAVHVGTSGLRRRMESSLAMAERSLADRVCEITRASRQCIPGPSTPRARAVFISPLLSAVQHAYQSWITAADRRTACRR